MRSPRLELARIADATRIGDMARCVIEHGLPWRWRPPAIARLIRDADTSVIVAREHERITGFGAMKFQFGSTEAHLLLLAVDHSKRRNGLGTEMLAWFDRVARLGGVEFSEREVRAASVGAHAFYEHFGFRTVNRMRGYYEQREDALRMVRELARKP